MLKSPKKKWSWLGMLVCGLVFLLFNKQIQVKLCRKILLTIGNNIKRNIIIIGSTSFIQSLRYIEPLFSNSIPLNRTLFHSIPYYISIKMNAALLAYKKLVNLFKDQDSLWIHTTRVCEIKWSASISFWLCFVNNTNGIERTIILLQVGIYRFNSYKIPSIDNLLLALYKVQRVKLSTHSDRCEVVSKYGILNGSEANLAVKISTLVLYTVASF